MKNLILVLFVAVFFSCTGASKKETSIDLPPERNYPIQENITDEDELFGFTVYGSNHIAMIPLPKTWTVDMNVARQLGVAGFFYMKNYTVSNTPAGIILVLAGKPDRETDLDDYISYDISVYKDASNKFYATNTNWNMTNKNNYEMMVYCIKNDETGFLEYIAYFDPDLPYYAKVSITVQDENKLDEVLNDFKRCLEAVRFSGAGLSFQ